MKRALAALVVIALLGVAIADHGSSAATAAHPRGVAAPVRPTPPLKRLLHAEITTLRLAEPAGPRVLAPRTPSLHLAPGTGTSCFVAGPSRCSEIPCRQFATSPTVLPRSGTATRPPSRHTCLAAPLTPVLVVER